MGKRTKQQAKSDEVSPALAARPFHPPAKRPALLAVSIVLFALWFAFLLVTAVFG
jgi:hypothetical protein